MDREHLHLLIDEEIYLIQEESDQVEAPKEVSTEAKAAPPEAPIANDTPVDSPAPTPAPTSLASDPPAEEEAPKEDPTAPSTQIAIFHSSSSEADVVLLEKIIAACKLEEGSYQVYADGFDKEVIFQKALVFVASAKAFYEPVPYQESLILCSRPLPEIGANQQEKAKLWAALQKFF